MTDSIELRGIQCFGYHGVYAEEQTLGQRFVLDLVLDLDLRPAAKEDNLTRSVDYGKVIRRAREVVEGEACNLIETVAERIASDLLDTFGSVTRIDVCLHKPNAPVQGSPVDDIAVRILRGRGQ
jgi:7,8-dihydroneopterin aldolase/epimerase/oxygenase